MFDHHVDQAPVLFTSIAPALSLMPSFNKYYFSKEHVEPRSVHGAVNKANRALTVWMERHFSFLFHSYLLSFSIFWPHHMACGILVPWPGIEPESPAVETWCLNHWATHGSPKRAHFNTSLSVFFQNGSFLTIDMLLGTMMKNMSKKIFETKS